MTIPAIYSSTVLAIAGDTAYDAESDAYDGTPVKVEPSAGALAQGLLRPGRQIPAQNMTWALGQFAAIMSQLITDTHVQDTRLDTDEAELADHEARIDVVEDYDANHSPRIRIYEFLASGTWEVPPRCKAAVAFLCGGGGAGGAGAVGITTVDRWRAGAGGGGGALASMQPLGTPGAPLVPGATLNIDIGVGGVASGSLGATGGNGGDSVVRAGSVVLARGAGAQGGRGSVGGHIVAEWYHYSMGGTAVHDTQIMLIGPAAQGIRYYASAGTAFGVPSGGSGGYTIYIPNQPAQGGYGGASSFGAVSSAGSPNPTGNFAPGAGGAPGVDGTVTAGVVLGTNTTRRGGGGGGGGAAGPFGGGGPGGGGQSGDPDAGSVNRTDGYAAAANSGAGGGGGGSGGYCANITNVGGNNDNVGGDGGSGRVYIITVEESP